jgi:hypothetical protein
MRRISDALQPDGRGSFDPMVTRRTKSLIIEVLAKRSDRLAFHVCYRFLPSAILPMLSVLFVLDTN